MKKLSVISFIISLLFILSCEDDKDTTGPEVAITSPTNNATLGELVTIKVNTTDKSGILKVDFYIDNSKVFSDTTLPYEYEWNTTTTTDSEHTIKVTSYDMNENFTETEPITVTVNNETRIPNPSNITSVEFINGSFVIKWSKNTDSDFKSYTLYSSDSVDMSNGKIKIITLEDISQITYEVKNISGNITQYYQLVTEDIYGLQSESNVLKGSSPNFFIKIFNYGPSGYGLSVGQSVKQTNDNGFIVIGTDGTKHYGGTKEFVVIKTDSIGNEEWNKYYDEGRGYDISQTADGGYIFGGKKNMIKTDYQGNKEWETFIGNDQNGNGFSIQQTVDGGYIISGGNNAFYLTKKGSQGESEWAKSFGGGGNGVSVQQTTDEGYIIAGYTIQNSWKDARLVKTNSNGDEEWMKTFGGTGVDVFHSVQQTTDGGFLATGFTTSSGLGASDIWLIKVDSQGNEEWQKTYGGATWDIAFSIQKTTDGLFIIAGISNGDGKHGDGPISLMKVDSQGNEIWTKLFKNEYGEDIRGAQITSVQNTKDGGYIITSGYTDGILLIKTDSNGYSALNK